MSTTDVPPLALPNQRRLRHYLGVVLLLLLFCASSLAIWMQISLTNGEAQSAWIIQDTQRLPTIPRDALRYIRQSLENALARTPATPKQLFTLPRDLWSLLFGTSVLALRLPLIYGGMLVISIVHRLLRRWLLYRVTIGISLFAALLLVLFAFPSTTPDWHSAVAETAALRQPQEPAVRLIADDSPIAYYNRDYGLFEGITLNLAWRTLTPNELTDLLTRFQVAERVWLFAPLDHPALAQTRLLLQTKRTIGYEATIGNVVFYRFDT